MAAGGNGGRQRPSENGDARRQAPERVPPHNLEAEESLLGAALLARSAAEIVATELDVDAFYKPAHIHIAGAIRRLFLDDQPIDAVTVADELRREGVLDDVGGLPALYSLETNTPATTNAGRYAKIVDDHATLRALAVVSAEVIDSVYDLPSDVGALVIRAHELLERVAANGNGTGSNMDVADVAAILDGTFELVEADVLRRSDGQALLYTGKMNLLFAPWISGKSWLALTAGLEVLDLGGAVIYVDYEDTAAGIVGRLLTLGGDPAVIRERFRYVRFEGGFGPAERVALEKLYAELNPDLVVIDGLLEAMSREGLDEDRSTDVATWFDKFPRWLARKGSAVLVLDHVTKDPDKRGGTARGSGHKLAVIDGAAYEVIVTSPFSRHREGKLRLRLEKDRNGATGAKGETVAVVTVTPAGAGERLTLSIDPDTARDSKADPWKPTRLMAAVSSELERSASPLTAAAVVNLLAHSKPSLVKEAIARLMAEGYIAEAKSGRSKVLRVVRPYVEGDEPGPFDDEAAQGDLELGIDPNRPPGDPGF